MNTIYNFPADIVAKKYDNYILLISPNNGNWIVLESQEEVDIVKALLKGKSVEEIKEDYSEGGFGRVIKEIKGRHFCEPIDTHEEGFTLRVYLTNACNLRCRHCFMYADNELENELTYEEIRELLLKSKEAGCKKVTFSGGEVTVRKDFIEIIKYAKSLNLYVQVMSNGTLWDEEKVKTAARYIDEIQISVDGIDEKTNSYIRGKGTFEKALKTVDMFQKLNIYTSVIITPVYGFLEKYKDEYIEFGKKLVNKYNSNNFLVLFGEELLDGRNVEADKIKNEQMKKCVNEIYEAIYQNSELTTFVLNHLNNRIYKNCGYGGLTINANGDIYFCGRIHELKSYGNIRDLDYKEVFSMRLKAREQSYVDRIKPCNECELKYICGGGCRVSEVSGMTCLELGDSRMYERNCEDAFKQNLYKLMVESSEFLYW